MEENKTIEVIDEVKAEEVDTQKETESKKEEKLFNQEQVNKIVQERLAKETAKAQRELEEKLAEAEKLRKMNADEKSKYEAEKIKEENEKLKAQLNQMNMVKEVNSMLSESNIRLADELVILLIGKDAESTKTNVENFTKSFNEAVELKVKEMLKGTPQKKLGGNAQLTKEEFNKMSYSERVELYNTNKGLYDQLKGE